MSGPLGFGAFKSPHGAIGEHVPKAAVSEPHHLELNGLSLHAREDTGSRMSRDTDRFSRGAGGAYDSLSIWSKADSDHGWDRAPANHFASRPQSPQRSALLVPDTSVATPKTAPLPPYAAFKPVITPPAPAAVPLPQPPKSPSPPRSSHRNQDREAANQAGHHLQQLQSLMGPLVAQLEDLEKLKAEMMMWKKSCEAASAEVARLQAGTAVTAPQGAPATKNDDNERFTAVLLDGDTLIFHDKHLKAGPQGGQAAARALIASIRDLSTSQNVQRVTLQVFISKTTLGNSLIKAGLVASWSVFEGFWQGFSSEHGLISVIDVGLAKIAVSDKIGEHVKLFAGNAQCSTVVLGSNRSILPEGIVFDKVVHLKAKASSSDPNVISLPDIFRSDPVPVAPISFSSVVSSAPQTPRKVDQPPIEQDNTSQSEDLEVEVYDWDELPKDNIDEWTEARKKGHKKAVAGGKPTPNGNKKDKNTSSPAMNGKKDNKNVKRGMGRSKKDYGVRDMKPRPCHSHYLSPAGCRNDVCHYGHEYDLDDDQLNELAHLAKQIPCPFARGNRCHFDDETCIYGHKCPRGNNCTFDECRFDEIDPDHQDWN